MFFSCHSQLDWESKRNILEGNNFLNNPKCQRGINMYVPDTEAKKKFIVIVDHIGFEGMWDGCDRGIETSEGQYDGFIPDWHEDELNFDENLN